MKKLKLGRNNKRSSVNPILITGNLPETVNMSKENFNTFSLVPNRRPPLSPL